MKNVGLLILVGSLLIGVGTGLDAAPPELSPLVPPLKVVGEVSVVISQVPSSVLHHFLTANIVVTRRGVGVDGLDITIGGVRMIQHPYGQSGAYNSESNSYQAVSGQDLVMIIRPGKSAVGLKPPLNLQKQTEIRASTRIGSLITITAPADVVNFKGIDAAPMGLKQVVTIAWTGGVAPFKLSLLRNPGTSPLNFYTRDGLTGHSHSVPLNQFSSGMTYGVHLACSFPDFRFGPGVTVDPSSRMTLSFGVLKNFVVNIGR